MYSRVPCKGSTLEPEGGLCQAIVAGTLAHFLFLQIYEMFLHGLNFGLEICQILLQFGNLLGLGLIAAVEMMTASTTFAFATAVAIFAIASFFGHFLFPFSSVRENSGQSW